MRLSRKEYKEAEECLIKYKYNCKAIQTIPNDLISISPGLSVGNGKVPYHTSDTTFTSYIKLSEDKELIKIKKQLTAVENAKLLFTPEEVEFFDELYIKHSSRYSSINNLHISDRTFSRRKRNVIYKVFNEIKKLA